MIDRSRERQVSKVAHFDNLDGPVGEDVTHVPPPAADSVVAVVAPLHGDQERDSLHVGVHQRQKGTEVVSVNSVVDAMRQLDVLLRYPVSRGEGRGANPGERKTARWVSRRKTKQETIPNDPR
jgi:hypothetical protein